MNKSESKYFNTAVLMDEALLQLLQKKDFDYITIKEICIKAGVNRSTFYLHYENLNDLLEESLTYIYSKFTEKYDGVAIDASKLKSCPIEELYLISPQYIIPYLSFLKDNKKLFMSAISRPNIFKIPRSFDENYKAIFEPILERFNVPPTERKFIIMFYISGMHAIIVEWLKGGCKEDMEFIADLLIKYTPLK